MRILIGLILILVGVLGAFYYGAREFMLNDYDFFSLEYMKVLALCATGEIILVQLGFAQISKGLK
jgi:hypothetical protein